MSRTEHEQRLEELRAILRSESISYGELAELQDLAPYIVDGDVELLEAAGVPEEVANEGAAAVDAWYKAQTALTEEQAQRASDRRARESTFPLDYYATGWEG